MFFTALGGGCAMLLTGNPMLRPAPVMPEFAPRPRIVLSEATLCIPLGSAMRPFTWMM